MPCSPQRWAALNKKVRRPFFPRRFFVSVDSPSRSTSLALLHQPRALLPSVEKRREKPVLDATVPSVRIVSIFLSSPANSLVTKPANPPSRLHMELMPMPPGEREARGYANKRKVRLFLLCPRLSCLPSYFLRLFFPSFALSIIMKTSGLLLLCLLRI